MLSPEEAEAQRVLTRWFIDADEEEIILIPNIKISNGSGGYVLQAQPPRDPVPGYVIPMTANAVERLTLDGRTVPVEFILMMDAETDVEVGDTFTARGRAFEVVHVQEKQDYQTKAELSTVG